MILILGSNSEATAQYSKKLNLPTSVLVESDGMDYLVGHTSPQDAVSYKNLENIAKRADKIYFAYPTVTEFSKQDYYYEYLNWLKEFNFNYGTVENFPILNYDFYNWYTPDARHPVIPKLKENDAVFIGCSFTEGVGIDDIKEKYSTLVAEHFGLECVNLGLGGSSNSYFFDVISRLNFHDNQLVVLQLTVLERIHYCYDSGELSHIMFSNPPYPPEMLEIYNNTFLFYETLTKLRLLNQIAEARQLKLAIWLDNYKEEHNGHYTKNQQMYFYDMKSFVPAYLMQNYCVDIGSDKCHPGPESNRNIANVLINFIEKTYPDDLH